MRSLILFLILAANVRAGSLPYAKERLVQYGQGHLYLVQEPRGGPKKARGIFIYAHGGGGREEQGMDVNHYSRTFFRLRTLLNLRNFIYVCPRWAHFPSLIKELKKRYGGLPIYLAGASAGGALVYDETAKAKRRYHGILLLCPALSSKYSKKLPPKLPPLYVVSGEKDLLITRFCRKLAAQRGTGKFRYEEIAGGNHDAPLKQANWRKALAFLTKP